MADHSRIADEWVIQQFRDTFVMQYENVEKLANTTIEIKNVRGDTYKVPTLDGAEMHERGAYGSSIPSTLLDHQRKNIDLNEYILNVPVDKGELQLTNVDERKELAKVHAKAMGRRKDEWKLNSLINSGTTNIIVDGSKNLTVKKLRQAKEILVEENVPNNDVYIAIGSSQLRSLLAEQEITSSDYNTVKALVNGDIDTFMGFKFILFGKATRGIGGLPKTGDIRDCFVWQHDSTMFATGLDEFEGFWWDGKSHSWLSTSSLSGGSKVILPEGVIKVQCDETAAEV